MPRHPAQHSSTRSPTERATGLHPAEIDRVYGLEPIFEPGEGERGGTLGAFVELQCPWCGEVFGTSVDLTTQDRVWIEDCQVCCRAIQVEIELDATGEITSVSTQRDG